MKPEDMLCDTATALAEVAASISGKLQQSRFVGSILSDVQIYEISSPIEQVLLIGLHLVGDYNGFLLHSFESRPEQVTALEIYFQPQHKIGKYRVDFMLEYLERGQKYQRWVIEADGHEFHDKNEPQRRYEKKRERYIQSCGYKIMRFTGSEIIENPFKVAAEVIGRVTNGMFDSINYPVITGVE